MRLYETNSKWFSPLSLPDMIVMFLQCFSLPAIISALKLVLFGHLELNSFLNLLTIAMNQVKRTFLSILVVPPFDIQRTFLIFLDMLLNVFNFFFGERLLNLIFSRFELSVFVLGCEMFELILITIIFTVSVTVEVPVKQINISSPVYKYPCPIFAFVEHPSNCIHFFLSLILNMPQLI